MPKHLPKSMRGRTTLISTMAVFIVLLIFSASLVFATQRILTNSARELLVEQVDNVELLLHEGTLPTSLTGLGTSLIQVIDAEGNILAASSWATDLPALDAGITETGESSSEESEEITWSGKGKGPGAGTGTGTGSGTGTGTGTGSGMGTGTGTGTGTQSGKTSDTASDTTAAADVSTDASALAGAEKEPGADILAVILDVDTAYAAEETTDPETDSATSTEGVSESIDISSSEVFGDDGPYLIYRRGVESDNGPVTIVAMASLSYAAESARTVGFVLLCILPLALFVVAYSVWKITGKMLEPVEALRQRAEAISITDLDKRIEIPQNDMEIARLTKTFNEMLARVDDSVQDQRRFISDASHELKSPVAATRIMLETARDYPDIIDTETLIED
ncbi:MAG: HAMP domain-containing protein, partial [Actinobacteria bacterium]|nr:HAMP domain-containing protein [Actinomycetota bacterium]